MVLKLQTYDVRIVEVKKKGKKHHLEKEDKESKEHEKKDVVRKESVERKDEKKVEVLKEKLERPPVVNAKVYKLESNFVKHSIYITLGYIEENGKNRPIEIFINSKDLTKAPEYAVLTRLISAIFRKTSNPTFILEELKSIHDPNGGYFKNGKYIHSLYAEIAEVMERFFIEIGLMKKETNKSLLDYSLPTSFSSLASSSTSLPLVENNASVAVSSSNNTSAQESVRLVSQEDKVLSDVSEDKKEEFIDAGAEFKICPQCNMKTLKVEEGCMVCINPECGYSKCDD